MHASRSQSTPLNGAVALARPGRSRLLARVPESVLPRLAPWVVVPVAAIAVGWLIARGDVRWVAVGAVVVAFVVLVVEAPGPLAAFLLLSVMNGVPFVNLGVHRLPGGLKVQDAAVFGLAILLFAYRDRHPNPARARIVRVATIWSACYIAWWLYQFARSDLLDGIPWRDAVLYGRDFLYFAILLPLALRTRLPRRSLRTGGLLVFAGVTACAVGRDIQQITGVPLNWLVHPTLVAHAQGLTRIYSYMSLIINTALVFAAALLLSRQSRGRRWPLAALVVVLFADAALELTRANYFALAVALLVAVTLGLHAARYSSVTNIIVRLAVTVGILVGVVLAIAVAGGSNVTVVHSVLSRASSGVSDLTHSTGTVGYREQIDSDLVRVLGNKWPIGLGFLNPVARQVVGVPGGNIRNVDTGVFNVVMTMGVVGAILLYAPLVYGLSRLFRARWDRRPSLPVPPWILYGAAAWIAWVIAGSPTLDVLFNTPGLVMSALVLAVLGRLITSSSTSLPEARTPESSPSLALAAASASQ